MITIMTKKYNSPMLQVVSIKKNDILTTSTLTMYNTEYDSNKGSILSAGRRFDEWYEGY